MYVCVCVLRMVWIDKYRDVTLDEFTELMESHSYILAPAFDLQRALRQRILGVRFWEAETRVRQALFSG